MNDIPSQRPLIGFYIHVFCEKKETGLKNFHATITTQQFVEISNNLPISGVRHGSSVFVNHLLSKSYGKQNLDYYRCFVNYP